VTEGDRVLVTRLGKHGTFIGWYGDQVIVRREILWMNPAASIRTAQQTFIETDAL
jgi:hypothetical protein